MYVVPIVAVLALVILIGSFWAPIFAVIIAVPLFALFLAYVGFSRRADEKANLAREAPGSGEETHEPHGGIWGEKSA
jgi:hypothetical protein